MSKILEKVKALIARTSSPEKEEARTSALLACELIRKHNLIISEPSKPKRTRRKVVKEQPKESSTGFEWVDDIFNSWTSTGGFRTVHRKRSDVYIRRANYPGKCCECNKPISVGQRIAYYPGKGAYHIQGGCSEKAVRSN